ncbi:MAG: YgfZ/GcvT domain-containing protein [Microbacterium sp.]|uniref:CAF17-like 4Fe-4S cluster assembly/insertion protein YgfZ n=1 Tax=Microbacterium sp. TaxID=51671 RepID=UPI003A8A14B1
MTDAFAQHFGNPLAEQRALAAGRALAPLGDRRVLAATGPDRLTWLDSITSQALTALQPGESTELLVLDPQGRVEHAAGVIDDGETTWLLVDAPDADPLLTWLQRMRFRAAVELRPADEYAVIGAVGTGAVPGQLVAAPHDVPLVWHDPWPGVTAGGWGYAPADPHPGAAWEWVEAIVPTGAWSELAERAEPGALAGLLAADALRVAAWRPRRSAEVDERTIPHEVDWLRTAVHLAKGCYRGQETVAKVHNLGHPPRRLVLLHLDGSDSVLPVHGDAVRAGDSEVGVVTSAVRHYEDGPIALALVRRSTPADADLVVDADGTAIGAAQEVIVPADAGATASVPRIPRLGSARRTPQESQ